LQPQEYYCNGDEVCRIGKAIRTLYVRKIRQTFAQKPGRICELGEGCRGIPASIRHRLTEVISTNLNSKTPLPMMLKVGDNVDASHDLIVEVFAHKGSIYIGLLMLCPNPELK